jgi:hypothetical protein
LYFLKILQGGGGPVTVNASLTNVTVVGFGKMQVLYNSVDPVTYDFLTKLRLERLRIDGLYELLGRILVIPLRGKGSCWFDASEYFGDNNFGNITGITNVFIISGKYLFGR